MLAAAASGASASLEQWLGDQVLQQRMQLDGLTSEREERGGWALVTLRLQASGTWRQYHALRALVLRRPAKILRESLSRREQRLQIELDLQLAQEPAP